MLRIAAGIVALTAAAAAYPVAAQPLLGPLANEQRQIAEEIEDEQARNGPHSPNLIDPLTALALLYQESGDHGYAAAATEQALQVVRANYGLRSLEQAPLIRRWIHNEEARGNFAAAWDLEQSLLTLARQHPNDLRTVPILREIADKRMDVLNRYMGGEFPPQIFLGCFYGPDIGSCYAGSRGVVVRGLVADAWRGYSAAIGVILRNEIYSSEELRTLEMQLVRSSYAHGNYELGKHSLRRLLAYDVANSAPWATRIDSLIQMADWDLLHSRSGIDNQAALDVYQHAHAELERIGAAQTSIEQIFSPETPVVLPAFAPNPLEPDDAQESAEYIDVAFLVTKYGNGRKVDILDATSNVTRSARRRLVGLILRSRFRPRVTADGFVDSPVVVRYRVNE